MRRYLLASMLAVLPLAVPAQTPLPSGPHVVVSGQARVSAKPDAARTSLSVSVRNPDAAVVKQQVDAAVNAYLAALKRHSIAQQDVSASALSISEDFDYQDGRRVSRGFRGARSVDARIRDLDKLNRIIDDGLAAGMNQVGSVRFESTNEAALKQQAREQAAANSRERGEELARAFGAKLGRVYSINSIGSGILNRYGAGLDQITVSGTRAPPPAPPAAPGQYIEPAIDFSEQVQIVFEIIP